MRNNSTILVRNKTRDLLKHIGRKDQTYDQLINELIELKMGENRPESLVENTRSCLPIESTGANGAQ